MFRKTPQALSIALSLATSFGALALTACSETCPLGSKRQGAFCVVTVEPGAGMPSEADAVVAQPGGMTNATMNGGVSGNPSAEVAASAGMVGAEAGNESAAPSSATPSSSAAPSSSSNSNSGGSTAAGSGGVGAPSGGAASNQPGGMSASTCVPDAEACDNVDNDCDGRVDEALTETCGPVERGRCRTGKRTCSAGSWSDCTGAVEPEKEVCDAAGEDENCDGVPNEHCTCTPGMTRQCGKTMGACKAGLQTCSDAGEWGAECAGEVKASKEKCDGQDDEDCDGQNDTSDSDCQCINGRQEACVAGKGVCADGTKQCAEGRWGSCKAKNTPASEVCDRARLDENCDGASNEGCECTDGDAPMQCGVSNRAPCRFGTKRCSNGRWSACTGNIDPARTETCDGQDEDCDGSIDDGARCTNAGDKCENGRCIAQCEIPPESTYMRSCRGCTFNPTSCIIRCTECAIDFPITMYRTSGVTWNLKENPCTTGISNCETQLLCSGSLCPWDQ